MKRIDELENELRTKLREIRPSMSYNRFMGAEAHGLRPGWSGRPHVSVRWDYKEGNLTREEKRRVRQLIEEYLVDVAHVGKTSDFNSKTFYGFDLHDAATSSLWPAHVQRRSQIGVAA